MHKLCGCHMIGLDKVTGHSGPCVTLGSGSTSSWLSSKHYLGTYYVQKSDGENSICPWDMPDGHCEQRDIILGQGSMWRVSYTRVEMASFNTTVSTQLCQHN